MSEIKTKSADLQITKAFFAVFVEAKTCKPVVEGYIIQGTVAQLNDAPGITHHLTVRLRKRASQPAGVSVYSGDSALGRSLVEGVTELTMNRIRLPRPKKPKVRYYEVELGLHRRVTTRVAIEGDVEDLAAALHAAAMKRVDDDLGVTEVTSSSEVFSYNQCRKPRSS
jgi:hypothetical protein